MTTVAEYSMMPAVRGFLTGNKKLLIDGKWVEAASGKTFATTDPATGQTLTEVALGQDEDVDRAVRAARRAFDTGPWPSMKPNQRERLLWRIGDMLSERAEEFGQLEALDNGKSAGIATAVDVALVRRHFPLLRRLGHQDRRLHHQRFHAIRPRRRVPRLHTA